jgi:hypothetical protein
MLLAVALAAVYILAIIGKIRDPHALQEYVQPLAGHFSRILVKVTLVIELTLAAGLLAAVMENSVAKAAGVTSAVFLVTATVFHAMLLARSRLTRCHCFGRLSFPDQVDAAWEPVIVGLRNGGLVGASAIIAGLSLDGVVIATAVVGFVLILGLLESVRRQRLLLHATSHPLRAVLGPTMATLQAHSWWVEGRPRRF